MNPTIAAPSQRRLRITGLCLDARLGILDHEQAAPQPIRVDAELNLGRQPLLPRDDAITQVLDYRKVRQLIIDECTARHVNLLESLTGRIAHRLLALPGVCGVRVQVAKTGIFPDCEAAIEAEAGNW
jgi:dihydroneopterin aldolase